MNGGGGGGAELLGFVVPPPPPPGFEMSGREGRGFLDGAGGEERSSLACWLVGRGIAGREPGGRSAALPAVPSPTGRSLGTPPLNRPPIGIGPEPPPKPPPLPPPLLLPPPPPPGFSITGALRSLAIATFFSLVPLHMSDSSAPRPLASSRGSLGALVFAWLKAGGGGGPGGGGGGGGIGMLRFLQER